MKSGSSAKALHSHPCSTEQHGRMLVVGSSDTQTVTLPSELRHHVANDATVARQ